MSECPKIGGQSMPATEAGPAESFVWCEIAPGDGEGCFEENKERYCLGKWRACPLLILYRRAEAAEKDLALNAGMLAKQCDAAREAEIRAEAAEAKAKQCDELAMVLRASCTANCCGYKLDGCPWGSCVGKAGTPYAALCKYDALKEKSGG